MSRTLVLRNRQRVRSVDTPLLHRITRHLLSAHFQLTEFELGLHLVAAKEMAGINEAFLQHQGSTDVITFNHAEGEPGPALHGEIFICLDDAVAQARQFGTSWPSELVRYVIHGLLHLRGHDDLEPARRQKMKRAENQLLRAVARAFRLDRIARPRDGMALTRTPKRDRQR